MGLKQEKEKDWRKTKEGIKERRDGGRKDRRKRREEGKKKMRDGEREEKFKKKKMTNKN